MDICVLGRVKELIMRYFPNMKHTSCGQRKAYLFYFTMKYVLKSFQTARNFPNYAYTFSVGPKNTRYISHCPDYRH
jgi:hypothetical protein